MRLRHLHHSLEWLPEDFELPRRLADVADVYAWRVHRSAATGMIGMKLGPEMGAAIWDRSGKLLLDVENGCDVGFADGGKQALVLEQRYTRCSTGTGNANALRRIDVTGSMPPARPLAEAEICTAMSHGQYLILDSKGERGVVTWREQREWGYAAVDLRTLASLPAKLEWPSATLSPPAFAPGSATVVACHYLRNRWWVDEDGDWYDRSPGGSRQVATITVHDLATNQVSQHELFVTVPAGWLPDRPEEVEWQVVWGPEFVGERKFRVWLPDDSEEMLSLPLPARIEIARPLKDQRPWPE